MDFQLRDYQAADIENIRAALREVKSVLYVLPTGGGKTRVFSYMADSAFKRGNSSSIIVHRQELVIQSSIALAELGLAHRLVAPAKLIRAVLSMHIELFGRSFIQQSSLITVASVQTLARRLDLLAYIKLLIIDEAHHTAAGQWKVCFEHAREAKIIGVTATPLRLDGKGLGAFYQRLVVGLPMHELIARGFLCSPKIYAPRNAVNLEGLHSKFGDYVGGEVAARMDTPTIVGNAVTHYKQICPNVPAIAYCCSVEHAQHVADSFAGAGFRSRMIDGNTDGGVRRGAIKALGNGGLDVLTSCDIISEGTDIPLVGCGIMLRPTKSLTLWMQQAGRVLRPYPDNEIMRLPHMAALIQQGQHYAYILDHANNTATHGLPQQPREWKLEYDKIKRGRGNEIQVTTCPQCMHMHAPAMFCPECGYDYRKKDSAGRMPDEIAGTLEEIKVTTAWSGGTDISKAPIKQVLRYARTEDELREVAKARGFNPNWVKHILSARAKQ